MSTNSKHEIAKPPPAISWKFGVTAELSPAPEQTLACYGELTTREVRVLCHTQRSTSEHQLD
ncbi:MAG: hypothetical protein KDA92_11655 [Planctomycetales bacterium]|nr:hypothetical protein [Planctomycetales bacterium]